MEPAGWAKAHGAGGDTNGHTDAGGAPEPGALPCSQDLWMFPTVLLFQPEAARALLEYRIRTLDGALDNARKLGYQVRGTWHPPYRAPAGWCPHIPPRPAPIPSGSPLGRAGIPGFFQGLGSTLAPGQSSLAGPSSSPLAALACDGDTAGCPSMRASAHAVRPLLSSVAGDWWAARGPPRALEAAPPPRPSGSQVCLGERRLWSGGLPRGRLRRPGDSRQRSCGAGLPAVLSCHPGEGSRPPRPGHAPPPPRQALGGAPARPRVAWPLPTARGFPRTCSSSARPVAGTWSGPWLSSGAAAWSGAPRRRSTS